eukprot:scaffold4003_cov165-Amphora_coffeaeformis.AAC.10
MESGRLVHGSLFEWVSAIADTANITVETRGNLRRAFTGAFSGRSTQPDAAAFHRISRILSPATTPESVENRATKFPESVVNFFPSIGRAKY